MEKIYRLCEFGISIVNVRKMKYENCYNNQKYNIPEKEYEKILDILASEEYINGPNESVFELVEHGLSLYQAESLFKKNITVDMIRKENISSLYINPKLKNDLLRIKRDFLLCNEELEDSKNNVSPCVVNKLQMNKVYKLCEYNIPFRTVRKILNYSIEELLTTKAEYPMKNEIKEILKTDKFIKDENESVFELTTLGLDLSQVEILYKRNITIFKILFENIEEFEISRSLKNELILLSRMILLKFKNFPSRFYVEILKKHIEKICLDVEKIDKNELYESIKENEIYNIDFFEENLDILKKRKCIVENNNNIEYCYTKLLDKIDTVCDDYKKGIIYSLLDGETLTKIGVNYNYTSGDPIKKIVTKCFEMISPVYEEIKYKDYFEKYNWDKNLFLEFWKENEYIYEFLNFKYKKGEKDPYLLFADERTTEYQKQVLDNYYGIVTVYGEKIYLKRENLFKVILKNEAIEPIKIEKIIDIYNFYASKYNIEHIKSKDMIYKLFDDYKSFLLTDEDEVKFYDYFSISINTKMSIKSIVDVDPGVYAAKFFYNKYQNFFESININSPREMYSLFKLLEVHKLDFVNMIKYPHINIKVNDKKEFIEDVLNRIVPIKIDAAAAFFQEYYGFEFATIKTYLLNEFMEYIKDGMITFDIYYIDEEKQIELREKLNRDYYVINELEEIFKSVYGDEYKNYISKYNFSILGYIYKGDYAIINKYYSFFEYLEEYIENHKIINRKDFVFTGCSSIYSAFKKFEKSYDILKINEDSYISYNSFKNSGITKNDIKKYCNQIKEEFAENEFFTIKNVKERLVPTVLDEAGFEDLFYESIIINSEDIGWMRIDFNTIMYVVDENKTVKTKEDFINFVLKILFNNNDIIDYSEFVDYLENEYGMLINNHVKMKENLLNVGCYYNDIFRKIYKNKNIYMNTIYNEEEI